MKRKTSWRTIIVCLLLGLGTFALYSPALSYHFVDYDDQLYVLRNPHVNNGFTAAGLAWAFQPGYAANWHPLTWFSHMLDSQLFGLRPGWHHLANILLHALNAVLVFLVLKRMTGAFWRSAAVAAFFAWHPLHVESVAWISERKDVLSAFFFLLALWAYIRYVEHSRSPAGKPALFYTLALVAFALALMSKAMVVTLPLILILLDWWPLRRIKGSPQLPPRRTRALARPALPVEGAPEPVPTQTQSQAQTQTELTLAEQPVTASPSAAPALDPLATTGNEIKAAETPAVDPVIATDVKPGPTPRPAPSPTQKPAPGISPPSTPAQLPRTNSWAFLLLEKIPFFLLAAVTGLLAVIAQRREGSLTFLTRLPMKGRIIAAANAYYRYLIKTVWPSDLGPMYPMYLHRSKWEIMAVAVVLLGISLVALQLRQSRPFWLTGWFWFAIMIFPTTNVLAAGGQSMADRYMYLPSIGLFILICWEAYDLMASQMGRKILGGLTLAALGACCVASAVQMRIWNNDETLLSHIAVSDQNSTGHANYAAYLMHHDQLAKAEAECDQAIQISPRYGLLYALLGNVLFLEGKYDQAVDRLNLALQLDRGLVDARLPLGRSLLAEKRPADAARQFALLIQAEPRNFEAHTRLAEILELEGKPGEALGEFHTSLELNPNQPDALNDAAWVLATDPNRKFHNGAAAVQLAQRACELTRNEDPMLLGTLAAAEAATGKFDDAAAISQKAHDLALAQGKQRIADRNLELVSIYRQHKPYQEK